MPRLGRIALWRRRGHRPNGARRGQAITEMALLTPLFALILLGALDLGRLFIEQVRLNNAVKEAALYGLYQTDPGKLYDQAVNEVTDFTRGNQIMLDGLGIEIDCFNTDTSTTPLDCGSSNPGPGWVVEVRGEATFHPFTSQIIKFFPAEPKIYKTVRAKY